MLASPVNESGANSKLRSNVDLVIVAACVALYILAQIADDVVIRVLERWNDFSYYCFYSLRFWVALSLAAAFSAVWRLSRSFLLSLLVPVFFGAATGYLWAWRSQDVSDQWLGIFATPGLVGDAITQRRVLGIDDWRMGEPWFHRHEIAAWNTLVWSGLGVLFGIPFHYVSRYVNRIHRNARQ